MKKYMSIISIIVLCLSTISHAERYGEISPDGNIRALWHFNGNATDASGNGNDCTSSSPDIPTYTQFGKLGQGVSFDSSDWLDCGNDSSLANLLPVTICFWWNPSSIEVDFIFEKSGGSRIWSLKVENTTTKTLYYTADWSGGDPNVTFGGDAMILDE